MSESLGIIVSEILGDIIKNIKEAKNVKYSIFSAIFGHFIYYQTTYRCKTITIVKKYKFNRNGFTEFMVIDKNDNHYNVNNSFWHWKWDAIEN